jgi:hypothetical protein
MKAMQNPEIYFSADVEADGPIPGPYSMSSFGMAVAGTYHGTVFEADDPAERTHYAELRPIGEDYMADALAVSGLDRERLIREGQEPSAAMNAVATWINAVADEVAATPVFVAYPLGYDWMWMYWYFIRFTEGGSPFGHSRCLDMKTLYATKAGTSLTQSTRRHMPPDLLSSRPHTHNALDDAIEQAELFQNLMRWNPTSRQ